MSPTLIHHHVSHSSFLSLIVCKLPLQQRGTQLQPSAIHALNCLTPSYMSSSLRIVNPAGGIFQRIISPLPPVLELLHFPIKMRELGPLPLKAIMTASAKKKDQREIPEA